ncbi:hypothetical protein C8R47DRAFT_1222890 [Mycena vitilis]|nr:hypothetical protein C8R47DRAFT_1222890 [Mycena vitilis]
MPKGKGKGKVRTEPKKKPGNKGDFHGAREEFLWSNMEDYLTASREGKTRAFWPILGSAYWKKFDWRLELDEDPEPGSGPVYGPMAKDEDAMKKKKMDLVNQKIKNWYNHRRNGAGLTNNPFATWLTRLRRPTEACPRRIPDYQHYMGMEQYKDLVEATFLAEYPNVDKSHALSARCKVAQKLLNEEPEAVRIEIRKRAEEEHNEEVAAWKDADEGLPSVDEEDQAEARARFAVVVTPLLQALRAYTGYYVTLVGGRQVEGKFDVVGVHAGTTNAQNPEDGQDFTEWSPQGYGRFLDDVPPVPAPIVPIDPVLEGGVVAGTATGAPPDDLRPLDDDDDMAMALIDPTTHRPIPPTPPPADRSLSGRMAALAIMTSPLRESLEALTPKAKDARIGELEKMGNMALQRANNEARNKRSLTAAKATGLLEQHSAPAAKGKKRPAGKPKGRKAAKRLRRVGESDEESASETSDDDDGEPDVAVRTEAPVTRGRAKQVQPEVQQTDAHADEDANGEGTNGVQGGQPAPAAADAPAADAEGASTTPTQPTEDAVMEDVQPETQPKSKGAKGAKGAKENAAGAKWAREAKATLEEGAEGWGGGWVKLVGLWWAQEASTAFATQKQGFTPAGRPEEIKGWVKAARKGAGHVAAKDAAIFVAKFKVWWKAINPQWRIGADETLKREEDGPWDVLRVPGPNAFLNVLICLKWWKEVGEEGDWADVVADVTWVLERLIATRHSPSVAESSSAHACGATAAPEILGASPPAAV